MFNLITSLLGSRKNDSMHGQSKRKKSSRERNLTMEPLEDRSLLSAISFASPETYSYNIGNPEFNIKLNTCDFVQSIDMDGDGTDDIVTTFQDQSSPIYFYKGSADGKFAGTGAVMADKLGLASSTITIADVTGDGIPDLVALYNNYSSASSIASVRIFAGARHAGGTPTFGETAAQKIEVKLQIPTGFSNGAAFESMVVANLNGDTYPDMIVSISQGASKGIFSYSGLSKSSGCFAVAPVELKNGSSSITEKLIGVGNYAGVAGNVQLITKKSNLGSDNAVNVYSGAASGTNFTLRSTVANTGISAIYAGMTADVPSGTNSELISGILYDGKYAIQILNWNSAFTSQAPGIIDIDLQPTYITVGQLTGASSTPKEIFVSNGSEYQVLSWNASAGKFEKKPKVTVIPNYFHSAVQDFNGDGVQDIIAIGDRQITFFPGCDLTKPQKIADIELGQFNPANPPNAIFGDFNGDGVQDLAIIAGNAGTDLYIFQGGTKTESGSTVPTFNTIEPFSLVNPTNLAVGNFFGNYRSGSQKTKMDLAVLHSADGSSDKQITIYKFNQNCGIELSKTTNLGVPVSGVSAIAVGDFSGTSSGTSVPDGYDDIVIADRTNASVIPFRNTDTHSFALNGAAISVGKANSVSDTSAVALSDLDSDGRLDIVALNKKERHDASGNPGDTGEIAVLLQKTQGNFTNNIAYYSVGGNPDRLILGDLDGDSSKRTDILVGPNGSTVNRNFTVFTNFANNTPGQFTPGVSIDVGKYTDINKNHMSVALGKADANASIDIVLAIGDEVRKIHNNNVYISTLASAKVVFREFDPTLGTADTTDPTTLAKTRTWVDEWSSFYVEIWAKTDGADGIKEIGNCALDYESNLFRYADTYVKGPGFTTVNISQGTKAGSIKTVTISSTTGIGKGTSTGGYTLLARLLFRPATSTNLADQSETVGVPTQLNSYPTPAASGFLMNPGMAVTTYGSSPKTGDFSTVNVPVLSVFPVLYDTNNDGSIGSSDFLKFVSLYNKTIVKTNSAKLADYDMSGRVGVDDFLAFVGAYGKTRKKSQNMTGTKANYISYPTAMLNYFKTQTPAGSLSVEHALALLENAVPFLEAPAMIADNSAVFQSENRSGATASPSRSFFAYSTADIDTYFNLADTGTNRTAYETTDADSATALRDAAIESMFAQDDSSEDDDDILNQILNPIPVFQGE